MSDPITVTFRGPPVVGAVTWDDVRVYLTEHSYRKVGDTALGQELWSRIGQPDPFDPVHYIGTRHGWERQAATDMAEAIGQMAYVARCDPYEMLQRILKR